MGGTERNRVCVEGAQDLRREVIVVGGRVELILVLEFRKTAKMLDRRLHWKRLLSFFYTKGGTSANTKNINYIKSRLFVK